MIPVQHTQPELLLRLHLLSQQGIISRTQKGNLLDIHGSACIVQVILRHITRNNPVQVIKVLIPDGLLIFQ